MQIAILDIFHSRKTNTTYQRSNWLNCSMDSIEIKKEDWGQKNGVGDRWVNRSGTPAAISSTGGLRGSSATRRRR